MSMTGTFWWETDLKVWKGQSHTEARAVVHERCIRLQYVFNFLGNKLGEDENIYKKIKRIFPFQLQSRRMV
jgi:hypothetical protein